MDPSHLMLLVGAGLAAGFVAGLIGVGGGIIFAPVLFFYYQAIGISSTVIAPLTIGSSLFCTLIAAAISTWAQYGKQAVVSRIALSVGLFSALAVFLMTRFVTTQPWYDGTVFQVVFSTVLLVLITRMIARPRVDAGDADGRDRRHGWPVLAGTGTVAGAVASAAGVGGGVVLVPAYSHFLGLPIHVATGTSSATIVLISLVGVLNYALLGLGADVPDLAVGYVDAVRGLLLAVPAMVTAHLGVWTAHRINRRALRLSFAALAGIVAVRLLWDALL
ncbi:MAG: sulfite exporter TauE/SafE family protein [Rhodothermales bacterium]